MPDKRNAFLKFIEDCLDLSSLELTEEEVKMKQQVAKIAEDIKDYPDQYILKFMQNIDKWIIDAVEGIEDKRRAVMVALYIYTELCHGDHDLPV